MIDEPRTNADIIRGLLDLVRESEWTEAYKRCGRGCCGDWIVQCSQCGAVRGDRRSDEVKHEDGCPTAAAIAEADAFLQAEQELEEARERDRQAVPDYAP